MSDDYHDDYLSDSERRELCQIINSHSCGRKELEIQYGQTWDTQELQKEFEVRGFLAPFVGVRRKSDGVLGQLMFQHYPRFYFAFQESDDPV